MWTRRQCLKATLGSTLTLACGTIWAAPEEKGCTLSFGTYGMKGVPLERAIAVVGDLGYDGIEIATMPGYEGEPTGLSVQRRRELRQMLAQGPRLTALMENLAPATTAAQHRADLERLGRVVDLACDLAPAKPPLVQTVLGGGKWEQKKNLFLDRLGDWVGVARSARVVLAIKPHRGGAMSRPAEAIWLIQQLGDTPWLRMVYDYSHYAFRDMTVEQTVREALPYTAHIAVKDAVQVGERIVFQLPGASGTFDYARLLRYFHQGGYRGDVCCEVSSMVSGQPGYDPLKAATVCYRNMVSAFSEVRIPRD
jgi:inosose dehydratase